MKTILYGNGFNLLNGVKSWKDLVHVIDDSKDIDKDGYKIRIPNTLQYDAKTISQKNKLKESIVKEMKKYRSHELFEELLSLDVDHFITTNYDNVADDAFQSIDFKEDSDEQDKSETMFSIHRKKCFKNDNGNRRKYLWKIHGELSNVRSIMLGYNHYCSYVGQIKKYINGEYNYAKRRVSDPDPIQTIKERLKEGSEKDIISWIDLFFKSDVYIIGLGLYYDEIDLWWLLTKRKELMEELGMGMVCNTIVFYGDCGPGMASLLRKLDVDVIPSRARTYESKYRWYIKDIKKRIN